MGVNAIDAGYDTTYVARAAARDRLRRDAIAERARRNLAVTALDQPDPEGWLRETLDILGLLLTDDLDERICACGRPLPQTDTGRREHHRTDAHQKYLRATSRTAVASHA
jgi:hypothetical protein